MSVNCGPGIEPTPGALITLNGGRLIIADELREGVGGRATTVLAGLLGGITIFVGSTAVLWISGAEGSISPVKVLLLLNAGGSGETPVQS